MQIGVNWTYPQTFSIIEKLIQNKLIDFCELSLDNFIHLPPSKILTLLRDLPVSLHILSSRFLERSKEELKEIAKPIKTWINEIKPIYVSDHLAQFTMADGRFLPLFKEIDYQSNYNSIKNRVLHWQELLGQSILFENFPSNHSHGNSQPEFFEKLLQETDAGLLFDFSNAYIAELNSICHFQSWSSLIKNVKHCHVSGYRFLGMPPIAMDTHDTAISENVLEKIKLFSTKNNKTIVMELDSNIEFEFWKNEIYKIKNIQTHKTIAQVIPVNAGISIDASSLSMLSTKTTWHNIFNYAPMLLPYANDLFESFLLWADRKKIPMNWATHIHLLNWLYSEEQWRSKIDAALIKQLLQAAVTRWSMNGMDHYSAKGLILTASYLPAIAVGIWKNSVPDKAGNIVILKIPERSMPEGVSYALSDIDGDWSCAQYLETNLFPRI